MDGTITIAEITQQHAPVLLRTAELVNCLRACTLVAATPQAARIQLPNVGGNSPLFTVALSTVANDGLDVLGDATTYFLDIQLTTRSMGSTLQRLQQSFGKPEEKVTHDRLLKRMVDELENCTKGSEALLEQVAAWQKQVQSFRTAVQKAQMKLGKDAEETSDQIGTLGHEIDNEKQQLERSRYREQDAIAKSEDAKRYQRNLRHDIALPRDFSALQVGYTIARFSWNWFWTRGAAQDAIEAQQEVEQRRQAAEEYELRIADAQIQLAKMNSKVFELEKYRNGLTQTLTAITILTDNIRNLVVEFSRMGPFIKQLMRRSQSAGELSYDYADKAAPGSEMKLFVDDMNHMGQFALTVEHMAWVYGTLIERVLIGGFKDCTESADADAFESCLALMKPGGNTSPDSSVCSLLLTDVDASYNRKTKALEQSHVRAIEAAEKMSNGGKKKKKRSVFSFKT